MTTELAGEKIIVPCDIRYRFLNQNGDLRIWRIFVRGQSHGNSGKVVYQSPEFAEFITTDGRWSGGKKRIIIGDCTESDLTEFLKDITEKMGVKMIRWDFVEEWETLGRC